MSDIRAAESRRGDVALSTGPRYVAGEVIADKYRLENMIGEGGMGSVWVAKNLPLDIQVALKLIRSDNDHPEAAQRLLTEARAAARLKHPSIVRVFDFGRTRRGDPFIVMELLQGETLGDVLDREGRVSATYAVQMLLPIADALAVAHSKNIVHRDLKPENMFLATADGRMQPKVVDFGIAKVEAQLGAVDSKLTQAGTVLGSPDYMSPEQARGSEVDRRADVWAFCVVLYETITGRVPFEDANYHALLRRIIEDEPQSIVELAAGDTELWQIIKRGLEKDRDQRWQSMRQLGEQLALWLFSRGVTEDVYGQSLRATWMDGPASTPGRPNPLLTAGRRTFPSLPDPALVPVAETVRPAPVSAETAPATRSRTGLVIAVAAVVIAISGTVVAMTLLRSTSGNASGATPSATPAASTAGLRAPSAGSAIAPPTPAPASASAAVPPASAAPTPEPAPSVTTAPVAPHAVTPRPSTAKTVEKPAPAAKPPAPKAHKDDDDLGF